MLGMNTKNITRCQQLEGKTGRKRRNISEVIKQLRFRFEPSVSRLKPSVVPVRRLAR